MIRVLAALAAAALLVGGAAPPAGAPGAPPAAAPGVPQARPAALPARPRAAAVGYLAPLPEPLRVWRRFDPPATPYGRGHRGVDLEATSDPVVRAAAAGVVTFAGPVAGRAVVVVLHADGISTEYEPLRPSVVAGAKVRGGEPIGRLRGVHRGCGARRCLHWGARRRGAYLDPLTLLRPLGPVRLLPWPRDG